MLGISRQTDYAVRVVLHLACQKEGATVSIAEISQSRGLPIPFVRRLIRPLVARGILASSRGTSGGLRMGRQPEDLSLLDVVEAIEGGIALNHCVDDRKGCPLSEECPVHSVWEGATQALARHLAGVRFSSLTVSPTNQVVARAEQDPDAEIG
jgi:Rrf2 family transcriptional regulator, iron-sulfur cluster assembly transcription factor